MDIEKTEKVLNKIKKEKIKEHYQNVKLKYFM